MLGRDGQMQGISPFVCGKAVVECEKEVVEQREKAGELELVLGEVKASKKSSRGFVSGK